MIFSEKNSNIAAALAKSWAAIQTPRHNAKVTVRTKNGGTYAFEYTDLNGILDTVKPVFIQNNLTIMQNSYTQTENNAVFACVETVILHESGEYAKSLPLKFPAAQSMQDFGGQITYMKRYSLAAMLGIATEKDDDANGMAGNSYQHQQKQQPGQRQPQKQQPPRQQQGPQLITEGQMKDLKAVLAAASTRVKTEASSIFDYAKLQLNIPEATSTKQLTQQQANQVITFISQLPAAN